ncbi:MAG: hypothetical protein PT120_02435 [Aphanizomenon gracile PMC649.10]|jgi:hypothetical protein|nr:hypothetical protein [Aphanizomenon gracile PMC638.10]MDM3851842.1 hypothetical protein [Aphanizomenon gracile PMC627.10]MDM3853795.1 hypothetical protein [Aphanizomenon gracile PMC649.10]
MLPQSYQTIFRKHLSEQQYLTLEILLLLIHFQKLNQNSLLLYQDGQDAHPTRLNHLFGD